MDALKGLAQKAMHSGGNNNNTNTGAATGTGNNAAQGSSGGEDYLDKGVDAAEKKFGINMSREQNEKYTDMARDGYEKQTGSKVNSKFSN